MEIILPKYDCMRHDQVWGLQVVWRDLQVPWDGGAIACTVWFGFVHGRKCFFIEPHSAHAFFARGAYYGFPDEAWRFAFFSKAALEFLLKAGKRPAVIHTHDWQTALVPVLLYEIYAGAGLGDSRVCHTMHNFRHQGITGPEILRATGLERPEHFCAPDRMGDIEHVGVNFTRGAILYSNFVTTVSPHHAWEVRHTELGCGLGHVLHEHQRKFGGILNGLDYEMWNPRSIPHIPVRYSLASPDGKAANTRALRDRLLLRARAAAGRRLRRPARHAEGPAPDPPRDLPRDRTRRPVRAARRGLGAGHQRGFLAVEAACSTTAPTATSRSATTRSSRT